MIWHRRKIGTYLFMIFSLYLMLAVAGCGKENKTANTGDTTSHLEKGTSLNTLTAQEKRDGWVLLFDGKTTQGWRGIYLDTFPKKGWAIQDGALTVLTSEDPAQRGGSIISDKQYSNFELSLEFKYGENANSGIKYFVVEREQPTPGHGLGLEYQIWNDEQPREANKQLGALYDLIPAENKIVKPVGEWNTARIIVHGNHVEHWLNGRKVVEFDRGSAHFRQLVAASKYKNIKGFGEDPQGHILLQDEGQYNAFRNIKIKEF
ncbi:MAG: DUF1080 domain-containing protein [Calditrichota bacterium]